MGGKGRKTKERWGNRNAVEPRARKATRKTNREQRKADRDEADVAEAKRCEPGRGKDTAETR